MTTREIELEIGGMTCEACVRHVREALEAVAGSTSAEVSLEEERAVVRTSGGRGPEAFIRAVEAAGYAARPSKPAGAKTLEPDGPAGQSVDEAARDDGGAPRLLVVGGGSAGFAAAIRAAELGARVTLVERGVMGGTCVNRGCVPSKTLLRAAEVGHLRTHHPFAGIPAGNGAVDLGALVDQKRELVERLRAMKYRDVLAAYPSAEYLQGEARFTDPGEIEVTVSSGGKRVFPADRVVLATGARPWIPDVAGLDALDSKRLWTNEEALESREVPERLLVAGAGPVGLELAQLFSRLGSRVTVAALELQPGADREMAAAQAECLRAEGVEVVAGARLARVEETDARNVAVAQVDGEERAFPFDRLLMALGRTANTDRLGVEAAGLETAGRGFLEVDDGLATAVPGVHAAGDCTTLPQFVYVAARAGTLAAENALGGHRRLDLSSMPAVVFTDPQLAWVGLTEEEARERGEEVAVRTLSMEHVPRALANRDTRGRIKIVAAADGGRILGVHVLAPHAGEVIQTAVLAVRHGLTVDDLIDTLFPYLTEVEGLKLAAQTFGKDVSRLSCCAG